MILKYNDELYWFPKWRGGDFLEKVLDSSPANERYSVSHDSIFSMIKHGAYNGEIVHTSITDPLEEYHRNLYWMARNNLLKKETEEQHLRLSLRSTANGMVQAFLDSPRDHFDFMFGNCSLFRPSILEQCIASSLGVNLHFVSNYDKFLKGKFLKFNRSEFNRSHYDQEDQFNAKIANEFQFYLEGLVYKHIVPDFTFEEWMFKYTNIKEHWQDLFEERDASTNQRKAKNCLLYVLQETDFFTVCSSERHFFNIIKENFDTYADIQIPPTLKKNFTALENNISKPFEWIEK